MMEKEIKKEKEEKDNKLLNSKSDNSKSKLEYSLELLRDIAVIVGGKNASQIVDLLVGNKHVNEFIVAKKLDLTINQTRNILYKLADEGLVSSIRKKDKKKGWYTYFWIFNSDKAFGLLRKNMLKEVEQSEHQLKSREVKQFYICPTCNYEVTEETALLHDFTCLECGEVYQLKDNTQIITEIKSNIGKLRRRISEVNLELSILEEKRVKRRERERKAAEKEKIAKRRKAAEARKKAKKKEEGKEVKKKKIKKKTKKELRKKMSKETKEKIKKQSSNKQKKKIIKKKSSKEKVKKPSKKAGEKTERPKKKTREKRSKKFIKKTEKKVKNKKMR